MAFRLYFNNTVYTATTFSEAVFTEPYTAHAALFIHNWLHDLPFTFYTSGSTGSPKAFTFTKAQLQASARLTIAALRMQHQQEHILLCLDAKFVGGAMIIARALELDCEITLLEPARDVLATIPGYHFYTMASFVPMQLSAAVFEPSTFNRFRNILIGGAAMPVALESRLQQMEPCCYHTYGMTETLSHIALRRIGKEHAFVPLPGVRIALNAAGCICVETPFLQHRIETHDKAILNEDGSFIILGRTDFVINSGGVKIHPELVERTMEEVMESQPLIKRDFLIAAVPDAVLGQKCVCVFDAPMHESAFARLLALVKHKLPQYHLPREMRIINAWPLTANGKIDRKGVNELIHNQLV